MAEMAPLFGHEEHAPMAGALEVSESLEWRWVSPAVRTVKYLCCYGFYRLRTGITGMWRT